MTNVAHTREGTILAEETRSIVSLAQRPARTCQATREENLRHLVMCPRSGQRAGDMASTRAFGRRPHLPELPPFAVFIRSVARAGHAQERAPTMYSSPVMRRSAVSCNRARTFAAALTPWGAGGRQRCELERAKRVGRHGCEQMDDVATGVAKTTSNDIAPWLRRRARDEVRDH